MILKHLFFFPLGPLQGGAIVLPSKRIILSHSVPLFAVGPDSIQVRRSDSQSREPGFKSHCGHFEPLPQLYKGVPGNTDSGGNVNEWSSRNYSVAECFPEKLRWPWNEQVCQGVKCKAL